MNSATETASSDIIYTGLWVDSSVITDPELRRSRPKPVPLPDMSWTANPQKVYEEPEWLGNSTAQQVHPEDLDRKIEALFAAAKEQDFEDGMESEFSKGLGSLIKKYGDDAMEGLAYFIVYEKVNAEVASEALRWLGRIDHPTSYHFRLWLLERSLLCSSARVRDGAALGLASLDDPHAISYLKQAIQREGCSELREDMEQVLTQLESACRCRLS